MRTRNLQRTGRRLKLAGMVGLSLVTATAIPLLLVAATESGLAPFQATYPGPGTIGNGAPVPVAARHFAPFEDRLGLSWDPHHLYIESNGLPDHGMMTGITAWQQQVPLPQGYVGENAWRLPLHPVMAEEPAMIDGRFLRGAIALAVNGIPIFNPQNNRGEISHEIGELDEWGGHCGRGDDYHYHVVPLHLEETLGRGRPLAYALDGHPILGLTEADGSLPADLDECHGHEHDGLGYHYHAADRYPYVIGGFRGEVTEEGGQVHPQPRAQPVRPALPGLRGAEITGFEETDDQSYQLTYELGGKGAFIRYSVEADGSVPFEFESADGQIQREVYHRRSEGGGRGPGKGGKGKGKAGADRKRPSD